ncbi:queuosine precursor transporter [Parvularcula sp. ZS-1/3]|uniref:Probable queuosine precursor transporter n=1 Tax=Parvularcula mediterranea TaxID=2732508 RepID=A0A7Y3RLN1_9PROT|nr:queuosine precursor transporter [Parvularcula mediterranea]NNU16378.1 queuosine precursor transporter [Parvularcula mediterranea]
MQEGLTQIRGDVAGSRAYKHFDLLLAATCVIVVCSNIIGAGKVAEVGGFAFGAGVLFFPLSYVLGDVLTEVYGYTKARRAIMAATAAALFAALMAGVITWMPPAGSWNSDLGGIDRQTAFEANFGQAPRIVAASLVALFFGEIANARVMALMKVKRGASKLWQRTIGSTAVGQGVDSLLFYPLAFLGVWPVSLVITVAVTNYVLKVLWEALLTPVTYKVVGALKASEGVEVFDAPGPD